MAADPAKCTVNLTAPTEVGKPLVGTLTIRCSNDNHMTGHVRSLVTLRKMDQAVIVSSTYPVFVDAMN